jgi:adenylate cyclase
MSEPQTYCAILFADVSGSTHLYESLGDKVARAAVAKCLAGLIEKVRQYEGVLIKTIGDEIMCTFASADAAVQAAWRMQESFSGDASQGRFPLTVRVGAHFGQVLREGQDVYGDAVNTAARVVELAKPEQILATRQTVDTLAPTLRNKARFVERATVRGKAEELDIFEIVWRGDDATRTIAGWSAPQPQGRQTLELQFGGRNLRVNHENRSVTIGRSNHNDCVVDDALVSRLHARIELRRDRFYLIDLSTNGTFVAGDGAKPVHVKRDEILLRGRGAISAGRPTVGSDTRLIHFEVCE